MSRVAPTREMCSVSCGAKCCRSPLVLQVTAQELAGMRSVRPDVEIAGTSVYTLTVGDDKADGEGTIFTFSELPGACCPFLDQDNNLCTVYDVRPASCRSFPDRPESWCLAWAEA